MKKQKLSTFICLLFVIFTIPKEKSFTQSTSAEAIVKKIYGVWVNTTYLGNKAYPQKLVFKPDMSIDVYEKVSQVTPNEKADFNILECWKDSLGYTYCKATTKSIYSSNSSFELWRFDNSGNTWESRFSYSINKFAQEMNPDPDSTGVFYYTIYSRKLDETVPPLQDSLILGDHTQYIYTTANGKPLKAFVFQPTATSNHKLCSAILFFHGGGWVSGEPEWAFRLARHYASLGMVAIAIQYRLSDQLSISPLESMADARTAVRWVRSSAPRLRVDPSRIALYGWSAGAHLAASTAVFDDSLSHAKISAVPNALVLISPAVSLESDEWSKQLLGTRADVISISPASHIRKGMPPTIVFQGNHDTITPLKGVQLFCDRMHSFGNRCDLKIYEGVGHMFTPDSISDSGWPRPDPKIQADALKNADDFLSSLGFFK